jgi:hypothetical protein
MMAICGLKLILNEEMNSGYYEQDNPPPHMKDNLMLVLW